MSRCNESCRRCWLEKIGRAICYECDGQPTHSVGSLGNNCEILYGKRHVVADTNDMSMIGADTRM